MKLIKILIPAILLLLGSCTSVHEDLSDCLDKENVVLHFKYMESGLDKFPEYISGVHVAIFDDNNTFVMDKKVSKQELDLFQGVKLILPAGQFRVICWANTGVYSKIQSLTSDVRLADITVAVVQDENGKAPTADNMFYAPKVSNINNTESEKYIIEVPITNSLVEKTIEFMPAHNTVEVFFKGVSGSPTVEITKMSQSYNFLKQQSALKMNYIQSATTSLQATATKMTQFFTPHFDNENDILIHITAGSTLRTVDLQKFMNENDIRVSHIDHTLIQILVEFVNGELNVTLPDWTSTNVDPNFE